jgi:hypothetical protein
MSFNLDKPKVKVIIAVAVIALVVGVKWSLDKVDSGIVGAQDFVMANPIVKSKQIGYISKVYEDEGKKYLKFDDVKFLMGDEAIEAAKKDGAATYENGEYYVDDDYYIVNSSEKIKSYVISDNASLNLLGFWIDSFTGDGNNHSISYNKFKSISSKNENMLCYIYAENNIVVKVEGQFTP